MISALERFDPITAAGVLSRAALALDDEFNPAARTIVTDEGPLRHAVLKELRERLGLSPTDFRIEALSSLADALDREAEQMLGNIDEEKVFERLSYRGDLPSDLFKIEIIDNIREFHGSHLPIEMALISETVRHPSMEQHYGGDNIDEPVFISLFARQYPNKFPHKSFYMLVAGQRAGLVLHVHQAWRVYPSQVNLEGTKDLVGMLERFADTYGVPVKVGAIAKKFILAADIPDINSREISAQVQDPHETMLTAFTQDRGDVTQKAMVMAIDLIKYRKLLRAMGEKIPAWNGKNVISQVKHTHSKTS